MDPPVQVYYPTIPRCRPTEGVIGFRCSPCQLERTSGVSLQTLCLGMVGKFLRTTARHQRLMFSHWYHFINTDLMDLNICIASVKALPFLSVSCFFKPLLCTLVSCTRVTTFCNPTCDYYASMPTETHTGHIVM